MADGFIKTKCSSYNIRGPLEFECVKFESYRRKNKIEIAEPKTFKKKSNTLQEKKPPLNLKIVRHEVVKFGISGFDAPKREEARIALAVSLGAKPPQKEYRNYKELIAQKKKEKKEKKDMLSLMQSGKDDSMMKIQKNVGKSNSTKKGLTGSGDLLNAYGKVKKQQLKQIHR